jgi:molybdate transport system ATP-binding protein
MIHVRIRKSYPLAPGSAAFSLDVEFQAAGGVTVLFGPSGSGKTLTLDAIAGFCRPDHGRILLDDKLLFDAESGVCLPPQTRRCGYVFQNYALFPHMSLRQNLAFAAKALPRLERHRKVNEMLDRFQLSDVSARLPHELSGGQKQRGSIARALIGAPSLLLLDEPARGLDAPLRAELYDILNRIREQYHTPVVLVTHDLEESFAVGDQMLVFRDGRIVQCGSPSEILNRPEGIEVARMLGAYNLLQAEIIFLDPGNNRSRLRLQDFELEGPYLPGHFRGDRVTLCVRPEELTADPDNSRRDVNLVPLDLKSVSERPHAVRLEFEGRIQVDVSLGLYGQYRHNKKWGVAFPREALRVLNA